MIIPLFLILSCTINENILKNEGDLRVGSFNPKIRYVIKKDSVYYVKLERLIKNNLKGWHYTPATYISGIVVAGKEFTLNFLNGTAIINYKDGDEYKQYYKKIEFEEYKFLFQPN